MAEHVIITEGSGLNVIPIDALVKKITTNDVNVALEANTFYELGHNSQQTLTLPTVSKDGDLIGISGVGSGGFKIIQAAGEQILFGTEETTIGTFGTLESTQFSAVLYLRRLLTPGLYLASTPQGEFLIDAAGDAILQNAINNTVSGSDVTLTATGLAGLSIVSSGVGPGLGVMKIDAGLGLSGGTGSGSLKLDAETASIIGGPGISTSKDGVNDVTVSAQDVPVSSLASGIDGELITWDSSGVPDTVAVGTAGQVLTSLGAGNAPTFQDADGDLEHGFVSMNSNVWTGRTFSFTSSFSELIPIVASYTSVLTSNFTNPLHARLTYTGTPSKKFVINANVSIAASDKFAIAIAINGTTQAASESYMNSAAGVVIAGLPVTLVTNDVISVYALRDGSASKDVLTYSLSATEFEKV